MPSHPLLSPAELESICRVIADTDTGLSGTEIGTLLAHLSIADPAAGTTKWRRLLAALSEKQQHDGCSNNILSFITEAMKPVRYMKDPVLFESRRLDLNHALVFIGIEIGIDGQLRKREAARSLSEAEARAGRLKSELLKRNVHPDVLRSCRPELLQDNYFHAVLEATKSISDKIRKKTGLSGDAGNLARDALSLGKTGMPFLAFNTLQTDSEKSEQNGVLNLMMGVFGTFRNTTAHAPKLSWNMTEQDALDLLTMASFLHRRLDSAARTPRTE